MEPLSDENGNEIKLKDIVEAAARELMSVRRNDHTNLVKGILLRAEQLTFNIKSKKRELAKMEESLEKTLAKIERLKSGDWSVLKENNNQSKPDSETKGEDNERSNENG